MLFVRRAASKRSWCRGFGALAAVVPCLCACSLHVVVVAYAIAFVVAYMVALILSLRFRFSAGVYMLVSCICLPVAALTVWWKCERRVRQLNIGAINALGNSCLWHATAFGGEIAFCLLPALLYLGLVAAFCSDANWLDIWGSAMFFYRLTVIWRQA